MKRAALFAIVICLAFGITPAWSTSFGISGANGVGDAGLAGVALWLPSDNPSDGATITIGSDVYEFDDNASTTEGRIAVAIGGNVEATIDALVTAINGGTENVVAQDGTDAVAVVVANAPGGSLAIGVLPARASSEVADVWVVFQEGRAANRSQSSGRIVLDDVSASTPYNHLSSFDAAFVSCSFYTSAGAPKATTATCVVNTATTPDSITIDPTAGATPLAAGDVVVFTIYE